MKLLIAGGGTGGHIYPAISIARAFQKQFSDAQVEFVGSPQGLETQIIPRENYKLHLISVGKLNYSGGVLKKIKTFIGLPLSIFQSVLLLVRIRPDIVLGVGGYVSGPLTLMSSLMGFKTYIWEPNAIPGVTNRWLSYFVETSMVVYAEAEKYLKGSKILRVGMPVREVIEKLNNVSASEPKTQFNVLIFGGSQGARAINQVVKDLLISDSLWRENIHFRHQTGKLDFQSIQEAYLHLHSKDEKVSKVECFEYLHDMENQYLWADLIICRSGASTVAELAACGKVALFIPLPWAADDHQKKNAESLVREGAATMMEQKDLNPDSLKLKLLELKNNSEIRKKMSEKIRSFHTTNAALKIAQILGDKSEES